MSKVCRTCKQDKDESAFDRNSKSKDGLRYECKECRATYDSPTYNKKKSAAVEIIEAPQVHFRGKSQDEVLAMAIELRMEYYRDSVIEAIFDLAMMPPSKNTLTNSIKLQAARLLAGPLPGDRVSEKIGEATPAVEDILKNLNKSFHENAPRIRATRETITFDSTPPAIEVSDDNPSRH